MSRERHESPDTGSCHATYNRKRPCGNPSELKVFGYCDCLEQTGYLCRAHWDDWNSSEATSALICPECEAHVTFLEPIEVRR